MAKTITLLFDNLDDARSALAELESMGVPHSDISIVAPAHEADRFSSPSAGRAAAPAAIQEVRGDHEASRDMTGRPLDGPDDMTQESRAGGAERAVAYGDDTPDEEAHDAGKDAGTGAKIGGVVGGGAGLLTGLGVLAIPGVGPVLAGGWLVTTVVGAAVGAAAGGAAGGLVGSLTQAGMSEDDAHVYAEGVRRGGTLVSVRDDEDRYAHAKSVLQNHRGVDVSSRGSEYRTAGWGALEAERPADRETDPALRNDTISDDPAPLSHALHAPTLSDDPAPLSHLLHIPVLSKD
jgi:hypothetical protein